MAGPPQNIDPRWARLRAATPARIGLRRAGCAVATGEHLAFQLAHAEARDAIVERFDAQFIADGIAARGLAPVLLHSAAPDRPTYLARPDLGRALAPDSRARLASFAQNWDLVFVVADGLSAKAITRHALPLLDHLLTGLTRSLWRIGPLAIVEQGRVAIGDEIGELVKAALVAVLIGERPGLTSPDSLGIYLTWAPKVGRRDAERNCLSNIRPEGMGYGEAAERLLFLCTEARRRKLTGVQLKDETALAANPSEALPDRRGGA